MMRAFLAGLTACILLATGGAAVAAPSASTTIAEPVTEAERQEFRQAISRNPILVIVMEEFPGEYAAFETQLLADAKAGQLTATQARDRTNAFVTGIQKPVIGMARFAPDEEIAKLYRMNLATLRALAKVNLQACYLFGEGAGVPADIASSLPSATFDAVAAYGAQELRAGIVGNKTRIERRPLAESEVVPVVELFVSKEGDPAYLIARAEGQADTLLTEDRCRNAILWMEAVVEQPNATMGRLMVTE